MSLDNVLNLCELMIERGYITKPLDYLMEYHFFVKCFIRLHNMNLS